MVIKRISVDECRLVTDLFNKYRVFYNQPPDLELATQYINDRLQNKESVIFVAFATANNKVVPSGFTQLYPSFSSVRATRNWILNDLYVDEPFRKQGVGEALLRTAMNFAKEQGGTWMQLETATDNHPAQSLYEQTGFVKQTPEEGYFVYRIPLR